MIEEAADNCKAVFRLFNKKKNQTLFKKMEETFLRLSLFFIQFYTNIIDRTYNDYECSAQVPSEI
jgi:hypothetical protein